MSREGIKEMEKVKRPMTSRTFSSFHGNSFGNTVKVASLIYSRCVNQRTHARTRPTTVTNLLNASTLATLMTRCTSANAGRVMLEMGLSVEKTPTWMDGPTTTLCVGPMQHITARRCVLKPAQE